jgi:hypothetical protein
MKTLFFKILLIIALFLGLVTCKKYPENNLWFKNPYNVDIMPGHITSYKVNGIDSLEFLNSYYMPVFPNSSYPYTKEERNIYTEKVKSARVGKVNFEIHTWLGKGSVEWNEDKKSINIFFYQDSGYYKKNIFIAKETIKWDIVYLDRKGKKTKIKTTYNNNTYEITFEV